MFLISACLNNINVRYNKKLLNFYHPIIPYLNNKKRLLIACPETIANLPTPRPPAEIIYGNGYDVLRKKAKVFTNMGDDVTQYFLDGAFKVLEIVKKFSVKIAIFTEKSPSCGVHYIYDGTFTGNLKNGCGVTTALLKLNGVKVFSQHQIDEVRKIFFN
ncbi:DUF523 domain-containing protein [Desulfonauticus submarinus]